MELNRETTVLFADVLGSADLYAKAGDAAAGGALAGCLSRLRQAAEGCGCRVVSRASDKMMVLAATPDTAADAAAAMHTTMEGFPVVSDVKLSLGIGFHFGPVIQKDNEVFGDTVNLTARLVEVAGSGQIITTEETARLLSPLYHAWMRRLYAISIKGRSDEVALCELVWRADDNATAFVRKRPTPKVGAAALTLRYRDKRIVRRREKDAVTLGRDPNCGLTIADEQASRLHCTIERRQDKFVLTDHSSNGTFVTVEGAAEVLVRREEFVLTRAGVIACGQPKTGTEETVEFSIE